MPKGCWLSSGTTAWADVEAEPDLPINFYVLWNVILQPHEIAFAWNFNMGDKVRALLALMPSCPACILDADFLDVRFIGVPLEPGIIPTDRCFDCFGITLLLCRGMPMRESVTMLGASSSGLQKG